MSRFRYKLYLVTDENACLGRDLLWVVEQAVLGGVDLVQLREKTIATRPFLDRALRLRKMLAKYNVPLIINDRLDIVLASGADGIHIGQSDMPVAMVTKLAPGKIMGLSLEKWEEAFIPVIQQCDYLAVSPLFSTDTKHDIAEPWGLEKLAMLKKHITKPLVVIGGINESNAAECIRHGADCLAVISAICSAPDPRYAAERFKEIIESASS